VGPVLDYDVIVVDAFASGHFLAMLDAPVGFSKAVQIGPMAEQTKSIISVLRNPELTKFHLVTLPEELPIQETLETAEKMQAKGWGAPEIWINRCLAENSEPGTFSGSELEKPEPGTFSNQGFDNFVKGHLQRQKLAVQAFPKAKKIPWILENKFENSVDQMAEALQ
jgi:anion-transporting  ArsA/GET3 family ATPase